MIALIFSALLSLSMTMTRSAFAADDDMEVTTKPRAGAKMTAKSEKAEMKAEAKAGLIRFAYKNADVNRVIEDYAKASGQKFIVDGQVKGKISIFNPGPISLEEAFNQLSIALASNSIAISTRDDQMYVNHARMIQRDLIPVVTEVPAVKPHRMVTLVINLKHVNADDVNNQLRILVSREGELVPYTPNNQLIISDWTPNLHRIADIVKQIDVPAENPGQPPAALAEPSPDKDDQPETPILPRLKPAPPKPKKR